MTDLEKTVIKYYTDKHKEDIAKRAKVELELKAMTDLYNEKCKELERAEVIIDCLFKRLERR